ncbi:unnamed protein product, partial [Durusdinium trenchii]
KPSQGICMAQDTLFEVMCSGWFSWCFQSYTRSTIEELEARRTQLAGLLLTCFGVQVLRLATGQLLSMLGLLTCLVGNKARCTLCDWDLWALVVVGTSAATLDLVSLAVDLGTFGSFNVGWRLAPCRRIALLGAILAPLLEVWCVQVALCSYIPRHEYLVAAHMQSYGHIDGRDVAAAGARFKKNSGTTSTLFTSLRAAVLGEPEEEVDPVSPPVQDESGSAHAQCSQCQMTIQRAGRLGTGLYGDCLYCEDCWVAWQTASCSS